MCDAARASPQDVVAGDFVASRVATRLRACFERGLYVLTSDGVSASVLVVWVSNCQSNTRTGSRSDVR
eukprot:scaffold155029_cov36-Prasinocladus_malaysianus.AAC.1